MKAWAKSLDESKKSGIRFLADPAGEFTRAWDVEFDAAKILGNNRSKRYAVVTDNGKVVKVAVEPDNTGVTSKSTCFRLCFNAILTENSLCCREGPIVPAGSTTNLRPRCNATAMTKQNAKLDHACTVTAKQFRPQKQKRQ
jgi:2-Cys peroxiredoxin 5